SSGRLPRGGVDRNLALIREQYQAEVASRVEAWIETARRRSGHRPRGSPPAWRRGSKPRSPCPIVRTGQVASRVEAWIETDSMSAGSGRRASPPAWRRGSKLFPTPKRERWGRRLPRGG